MAVGAILMNPMRREPDVSLAPKAGAKVPEVSNWQLILCQARAEQKGKGQPEPRNAGQEARMRNAR